MYRKISDFVTDFQEDSAEMQKNFAELTDTMLGIRAKEGFFSIGEVSVHLINAWDEAFSELKRPLAWDPLTTSATAAEIKAAWTHLRKILPAHVQANWTDAQLGDEVLMWGMNWTTAKALWEMQKHTIHHHGQLTVLLRLAAAKVHGVYGPSQEEAAAMNRPGD